MKTVTLKLDLVSKILLAIIAISLLIIAFRPLLPMELQASPDVIDVNIAEVYGESYAYKTYGKLPIRGSIDIDNEVQVYVTNPDDIGSAVGLWIR